MSATKGRYRKSPFIDSSQKYIYIPPSPEAARKAMNPSAKKLYNNIDSTRHFVIGVVDVVDGLSEKKNDRKGFHGKQFCIYDNVLKKMLCFDVEKLYDEHVLKWNDTIETQYGTFGLSEEARQMVLNEVHKN